MANDNLVLISGKTATGKSASLMNLKNPEGVIYLNCENNKKLPFKTKFMQATITDPLEVYEYFDHAETLPEVHTIVVDSMTFMMDLFESVYVIGSANTMQQWGAYAQFMKNLMAQYVAKSTKNVIFIGHTMDVLNEAEKAMETLVKVKGSIMNNGVEAFFSTVISTKKVPLKTLKGYESDLLTITEEEDLLGYKYVFQTKLTKDTVNERMRAPMGMWKIGETFIDNDCQTVIERLHGYYNE